MQFVEDHDADTICQITSCGQGKIIIQGQIYTESIIVQRNKVSAWRPQSLVELEREDFQKIIELKPEVVILGVGAKLIFPPPQLLSEFLEIRIGVEVMDSRAACRTFNVLLSEGRNVIGAFFQE